MPLLISATEYVDYKLELRRHLHFSLHVEASEAIEYGLLFYADPNTPSEGCRVVAGWLADELSRPPFHDLTEWA